MPSAARSVDAHTIPSRMLEAAAVEPSGDRSHADPDHDHIGVDQFAVAEAHAGHPAIVAFDRRDRDAAANVDAVAGMHPGDDLAHLGAEAADQRGRCTFEHHDRATGLGGGRGDLETDEPGADHDDPRLDRPIGAATPANRRGCAASSPRRGRAGRATVEARCRWR